MLADQQMAEMIQNEMFLAELIHDPEFAAYLRADPALALSLGINPSSIGGPPRQGNQTGFSQAAGGWGSARPPAASTQGSSGSVGGMFSAMGTGMRNRLKELGARFTRKGGNGGGVGQQQKNSGGGGFLGKFFSGGAGGGSSGNGEHTALKDDTDDRDVEIDLVTPITTQSEIGAGGGAAAISNSKAGRWAASVGGGAEVGGTAKMVGVAPTSISTPSTVESRDDRDDLIGLGFTAPNPAKPLFVIGEEEDKDDNSLLKRV